MKRTSKDLDILFNNEYDYIIPIGSNCRIGMSLRDLEKKNITYPIDWTLNTIKSVNKLFGNRFKNFFNNTHCVEKSIMLSHGMHYYVYNEFYKLNITHETKITNDDKYIRRINRLMEILDSNKRVLFIRNIMDNIIHDELHKFHLLEEVDKGDDDISLIKEFNNIIKNKYNVNHDILLLYYNDDTDISMFDSYGNIFYSKGELDYNNKTYDTIHCDSIVKKLKLNDQN
jgi:hypothetical protein